MQYQLTETDREILDALAVMPDLSEHVVGHQLHERFGNLTLLWQHVNALIKTEAALSYRPELVTRLLRKRDRRRVTTRAA